MRIPLAVDIASRNGLLNKDSKVVNALIEVEGESSAIRKRPGLNRGAFIRSGTAQALTYWKSSLRSIIADFVNGVNLSPTNAGLPFQFQDNGADAANPLLMLKNASQAWTVTPAGSVTQITDVDYPGTYTVPVTGITRSGSVATATTATDTNFQVGSTVTIAGAGQPEYNGAKVITAVTPSSTVTGKTVAVTITRSGTTATATTITEPHGLTNGQSVTIQGATQAEYNGTYTATYVSPTVFTYTVTLSNVINAAPAGGAVTFAPAICTIQNSPGTLNTFTATLQGAVLDRYVVGEVVTISGGDATINGSQTVATVTTSGFTFTTAGVTTNVSSVATVTRPAATPTSYIWSSSEKKLTAAFSTGPRAFAGKTIYLTGFTGSASLFNATKTVASVSGTTNLDILFPEAPTETPTFPATGNITATVNTTTVVGASFQFTVSGSPVTPATGTITAFGGRNTVPGIAYINGYFCVMDDNGVIYNSDLDNPQSWTALDFTTAQYENGSGVAIAKSQNYLVAFKQYSTEFFYDAQNPVGSPFSPVENGFTQIGCASGFSVAETGGGLAWVAQVKGQGRSVYFMQGTQQAKISTPEIDRVVNRDDLATVYAYGINVEGHDLYILTLVSSNLTLCYDLQSKSWTQWTSLTPAAPLNISTITGDGTTVTVVTDTPHGMSDGDPVTISGSAYDGTFQISYISPTSFSYESTAVVQAFWDVNALGGSALGSNPDSL